MTAAGFLVLEDGSLFEGEAVGAPAPAYGEVVFNTSMTGYQEMLTDPSYAGQILALTYPLIGNYGVCEEFVESRRVQVRGLVVRELCAGPSHWRSTGTLADYLVSRQIPALAGVDTRALTRRLRSQGVKMGALAFTGTAAEALERLRQSPPYGSSDFVAEVSAAAAYHWDRGTSRRPRVVVLDFGLKHNILRSLTRLGCGVTVVPATAAAEDVLALDPDGIVLSPGPGDPELLDYAVTTVRGLLGRRPMMGICLGHQVLGIALGGKTFKLPFGHRGGNHPVRDMETGQVHITSQNHGYAVDGDSLRGGAEASHINLNDGTVEGLRHRDLPLLSIQYHSEASPGPLDNMYLFERFVALMREHSRPLLPR